MSKAIRIYLLAVHLSDIKFYCKHVCWNLEIAVPAASPPVPLPSSSPPVPPPSRLGQQ